MARRGVLVGGLGVLGAAGWLLTRPDDPPRTAEKGPPPVPPPPPRAGRRAATLSGHRWAVSPVSFGAGGEVLASTSIDAGHVWDVTTRRATATFTAGPGEVVAPGPVAFNPEGDILAIAQGRETVRLWHRADGETLRSLTAPGLDGYSAMFSPDGRTLATSTRDAVILWDVATGRAARTLTDPRGANFGVAFAPDGRTLATGGNDGAVRLWGVSDGEIVKTLADPGGDGIADGITAIAFGGTVAVADHRGVRLWNVATGRATTLTRDQWVNAMAFSPDQRSLATVAEGRAKLWDLRSGRAVTTMTGVSSVAYSPDGTVLATGDRAGTIRLWKL